MSELYVVATPIGNLADITFRAVDILKHVDVILAEDTRNTSVLCEKYDIKTRLVSYHKFSEASRVELVLKYLKEGLNVALVSDAGTPLISDPGAILVDNVRKNGFKVVPIVGACAVVGLLSSVARSGESFKFIGFLPKSNKQIEEIFLDNKFENLVFYESPKRILNTLNILKDARQNCEIAFGRELTKKFEEIKEGKIQDIIEILKEKDEIKGEFVILIKKEDREISEFEIEEDVQKLKALNFSNKDITSVLCAIKGYSKNKIYDLLIKKGG